MTLNIFSKFMELPLACQACRGNFVDQGGQAASWAIFFMLMIIIPMLIAVGFFIIRIARRQKAHADTTYDDPFLTKQQSNN